MQSFRKKKQWMNWKLHKKKYKEKSGEKLSEEFFLSKENLNEKENVCLFVLFF